MGDRGIHQEANTLVERAAAAAMRDAERVLVEGGAQLAEVYVFVRAVQGTVSGDEKDIAQSTTGDELPEDMMERAIHIIATNLSLASMTARDSGIMISPVMMSDN